MKKGIEISIVAVLITTLAVVIWTFVIPKMSATRDLRTFGDSSVDDGLPRNDKTLTENSCQAAGGTWNPCGSACRTDPDAICIELCIEYCECQSDSECPSGYTCGDVVEDVGVCRPV